VAITSKRRKGHVGARRGEESRGTEGRGEGCDGGERRVVEGDEGRERGMRVEVLG